MAKGCFKFYRVELALMRSHVKFEILVLLLFFSPRRTGFSYFLQLLTAQPHGVVPCLLASLTDLFTNPCSIIHIIQNISINISSTDPVVTTDGHSYERANITEWMANGHVTSPFTNTTLSTSSLISNHNLRNIIQTVFFLR